MEDTIIGKNFINILDEVIKQEYGGSVPFIDEVINLKARCKDGFVEVFVVGKWRAILCCQKKTTEIKSKVRLKEMERIIRLNTGWGQIDTMKNKPIVFSWKEA